MTQWNCAFKKKNYIYLLSHNIIIKHIVFFKVFKDTLHVTFIHRRHGFGEIPGLSVLLKDTWTLAGIEPLIERRTGPTVSHTWISICIIPVFPLQVAAETSTISPTTPSLRTSSRGRSKPSRTASSRSGSPRVQVGATLSRTQKG